MSDWLKCSERLPPEGEKYDSLCLFEYGQMQPLNGCTTNGFAMSKRKLCNRRVQIEQSMLALVNAHHATVINIDPSGVQVMINWKNGEQILSRAVSDALCDVATAGRYTSAVYAFGRMAPITSNLFSAIPFEGST